MWQLPETLRELDDGGDGEIVLDLIQAFEGDTTGRFERLRDAMAHRDAVRVKAEAHSLRGSARQMGANELADLWQGVENAAQEPDWPAVESQGVQGEKLFAEVRAEMAQWADARRRSGA
jgi:HPt (histidine-containing phosphotransfer) domain-containing protein